MRFIFLAPPKRLMGFGLCLSVGSLVRLISLDSLLIERLTRLLSCLSGRSGDL